MGVTGERASLEWQLLRYAPLEWLLLSGDRLVISGGLLVVVAAVVWGTVLTGLAPLTDQTPLLYLLFALIGGNFTLIAIVVSISQFVLSAHLESPGEIRDEMEKMVGYRRDVIERTDQSVVPVSPGAFLRLLFGRIGDQVETLDRARSDVADERVSDELGALVAGLDEHVSWVTSVLEGSEPGVEYALFATLQKSYATYFYRAWRLRSRHADALPREATGALDELVERLEQVDVARRYFESVFIQSELSSLSRLLLYAGVPVQVASVALMLAFSGPTVTTLPQETLAVVLPAVVTAGFVPIVLLATFVVRLATVARRSGAMFPFTTQFEE